MVKFFLEHLETRPTHPSHPTLNPLLKSNNFTLPARPSPPPPKKKTQIFNYGGGTASAHHPWGRVECWWRVAGAWVEHECSMIRARVECRCSVGGAWVEPRAEYGWTLGRA